MLLSLLSLFFACEPKEEPVDCTMEFRYSATISLEDQAGNPISDAQIAYTVDGVEGTYVDSWMEGEYAVGGEESGDFVVEIFAEVPMEDDPCCWEIGEATLEFTIEADECHVISDSFEPELEWSMVCADAEECG